MTTSRDQAPESFLDLVEKSRRGKLKLYLGFAPGVGKTCQMLLEAHALRKRGVDVVLGFIEPHGRAETVSFIGDLEAVPRQRVEYRGIIVEELDRDAVLKRMPQIAIIDEIPHTNPPGFPNRRRYQDVLDILDAGINVICAFNIQHLESLKNVVEKIVGTSIRETVPDTFLHRADQIVTLDLPVEDLLERLKAGKIYSADKVPWALEHFFKDSHLNSLRELVLREIAEALERRDTHAPKSSAEVRNGVGARIMVCISSLSPRAGILLRKGARLAGKLNRHWFVVYVGTPSESPADISSETQRILAENMEKARELGAEIVRLKADDSVTALIDFARSHGVGHIIVGRSEQPAWKQWLGFSPMHRLLNQASGLDVHVVSFEAESDGL